MPRGWQVAKTRCKARRSFETFFRCFPPTPRRADYKYGRHTTAIIQELDRAARRFDAGRSTYLIVNVMYRHGKPLSEDSLVTMADGSRRALRDVRVGDYVVTVNCRARRVMKVHKQGVLPCLKITTKSGSSVLAEPSHGFLTASGWKEARSLVPGMALASPIKWNVEECGNRPLEEYRLAGYFVGDGSCTKVGTSIKAAITCADDTEAVDLHKCTNALGFGISHGSSRYEYLLRGGVRQWLRSVGLAGKGSYEKTVPDFVFRGGHEAVAHFLGAYFACDGTVQSNRIRHRRGAAVEFYSVSRALLEGVRHLLLRFGIRSHLRVKRGKYDGRVHYSWRLIIPHREDVIIFKDRIPIFHSKADTLARSAGLYKRTFRGRRVADEIVSVEPHEPVVCRCLTVEEDETFIANDFVVHNSDIVSRRFPVWFLGSRPETETILTAYNDQLATDLSRDARRCFREVAGDVWGLEIAGDSAAVGRWHVKGHKGGVFATGLGGTIVGRGAHALLIDDYCKGREEAESRRLRDKTWDSFTNDLMSRLAPVHMVVIVATRWQEDDLVGRVLRRNNPNSPDHDPDFPKFRVVKFPAWDDELGWLFPERYGASWYTAARAQLATYGWSALAQQDPRPRSGNLIQVDRVVSMPAAEVEVLAREAGARWAWGWDLVSKSTQIVSSDPDYTCGTLAAYASNGAGRLFVRRVEHGRWRGATRDAKIAEAAREFRELTGTLHIECVAGFMDAYEDIRTKLAGEFVVKPHRPTTDKVARAGILEPVFEGGEVIVANEPDHPWVEPWKAELGAFPGAPHDDRVDSLGTAVYTTILRRGRMGMSG